jgi:CHAD domain-containing protein
MHPEQPNPNPGGTTPGGLGRHLQASFKRLWRSYRKKLKRCQEKFSEAAVHGLRVETRRLLSEVELLGVLVADDRRIAEVRRELKKRLDAFDDLRDTQVELGLIKKGLRSFPELKALREEQRRREKRLVKRLAKNVKSSSLAGLVRNMVALKRTLTTRFTDSESEDRLFNMLIGAVTRAHGDAAELGRRIKPSDTSAIHRTRVAFKKFRYMVESLHPVLRGVGRKQLEEMHDYQVLMGDIQDIEVLRARMDKLVGKKKIEEGSLRPFRRELARRQRALINEYLHLADRLFTFWPPAPNRAASEPNQTNRR